MMNLMAKNIWN